MLGGWNGGEQLGRALKEEVRIEDLVRLVNTETGSFYRNRDLFMIFQRLKQGSAGDCISSGHLQSVLCSGQH